MKLIALERDLREIAGMSRLLSLFLAAEIVVIGLVILIFRLIENRIAAGAVAGSIFVLLGAWIVFGLWRAGTPWRWATFYAGCLHLFGVALPLLITRMLNASMPFDAMFVWGLPGPVFHKLSNYVYLAMMAATVVDLVRVRLSAKKPA